MSDDVDFITHMKCACCAGVLRSLIPHYALGDVMVRFLISVVMVLLLVANSIRAEERVQRDDSIAELKILDEYIGEWTFRMTSNQGVEMSGEMKGEWIHGGKLVRQSWTMEASGGQAEMSGENIMTFDKARNTYRQWSFNSYGLTTESIGTWDKGKQTLVWIGTDSMENKSTTKSVFGDANTEEFEIRVTSGDGEVLADIRGTSTRK